jgi:serine/threonine protein phosphatase 1
MIAVIGDIHGCYYTLKALYDSIKKKYPDIAIFATGDLVDRGKNSFEVIEFVRDNNIRFTQGNHDHMFYEFFKSPSSVFARNWMFNGNEVTMESYVDREELIVEHIEFIQKQPFFFNLPDAFLSHAGISVDFEKLVKRKDKIDFDLLEETIYTHITADNGVLWNRYPLMNLGKLQIVGHTKQRNAVFLEDSFSINIDTGACYGNKLTAIIVHQNKIIDSLEEKTHMDDLI